MGHETNVVHVPELPDGSARHDFGVLNDDADGLGHGTRSPGGQHDSKWSSDLDRMTSGTFSDHIRGRRTDRRVAAASPLNSHHASDRIRKRRDAERSTIPPPTKEAGCSRRRVHQS